MNKVFRSRKLVGNFVYIIVCIVSMAAATLAWFHNGNSSSADSLEFISIYSAELQVSSDGENYINELKIQLPDNLEFIPVSGSGKENKMYIPKIPAGSDDAGEATSWECTEYDSDAESNIFYSFPLYFRADKPGYVILSAAAVEPAASADRRQNKDYTDKNGKKIAVTMPVVRPVQDTALYSLIPNSRIITKDYIAGAARIGLVNKTNDSNSSALQDALFIANDTYHLSFAVTDGDCSCTLNENAASEKNGSYYNGSKVETYSESDLNVFTESEINNGKTINILELQQTGGNTYEGHIDVFLWIEGFDNEAKEILAGGQIVSNMMFSFTEELPE